MSSTLKQDYWIERMAVRKMVVRSCWNAATCPSQWAGDRVVEGLGHTERAGVAAYKERAGGMAWLTIQAKTHLWRGNS